jgi:hypothetical protein
MEWIERILGISPNGGSGALELLLLSVPVVGLWFWRDLALLATLLLGCQGTDLLKGRIRSRVPISVDAAPDASRKSRQVSVGRSPLAPKLFNTDIDRATFSRHRGTIEWHRFLLELSSASRP